MNEPIEHRHAAVVHSRHIRKSRSRTCPARLFIFAYTKRNAEPSVEGQDLLFKAQEMLSHQRLIHRGAIAASAAVHLKVVTGSFIMDNLLRPTLSKIHRRFPGVELNCKVVTDQKQGVSDVQAGRADLALYITAQPDPNISACEIISTLKCLLFAERSLIANMEMSVEAISELPFVLQMDPGPRAWTLGVLAKAGISPLGVVTYAQFGDVLAEMVGDGLGVGILFDDHVKARFPDRIERLPVKIEPAYRVMIAGQRAKLAEARPCLEFLRNLMF